MTRRFKVGDHVSWNSEAGRVSGRIIKMQRRTVTYKGYTHHASKDDSQYAIKSDKSHHVAMHKTSVQRRLRGWQRAVARLLSSPSAIPRDRSLSSPIC